MDLATALTIVIAATNIAIAATTAYKSVTTKLLGVRVGLGCTLVSVFSLAATSAAAGFGY